MGLFGKSRDAKLQQRMRERAETLAVTADIVQGEVTQIVAEVERMADSGNVGDTMLEFWKMQARTLNDAADILRRRASLTNTLGENPIPPDARD
ncbi:MAG: hypothetical protein F4Z31_14985 [Gemmatimonadetes bacterium]|nr:hypothetical protein [Gemmatimonadota bacterium]